jgi:hypothetical protein
LPNSISLSPGYHGYNPVSVLQSWRPAVLSIKEPSHTSCRLFLTLSLASTALFNLLNNCVWFWSYYLRII